MKVKQTSIAVGVDTHARLKGYKRSLQTKVAEDLSLSDVIDNLLDTVGWPRK